MYILKYLGMRMGYQFRKILNSSSKNKQEWKAIQSYWLMAAQNPAYGNTEKEEQRRKLTSTVMTASFKNVYWKVGSIKVLSLLKLMGESSAFTTRKEIRVFGKFRPFFEISQIFQIFWKTV